MEDTKAFIDLISPLAMEDMHTSGILASVTIAQAILESGWGTSELAVNANNFFCMKELPISKRVRFVNSCIRVSSEEAYKESLIKYLNT